MPNSLSGSSTMSSSCVRPGDDAALHCAQGMRCVCLGEYGSTAVHRHCHGTVIDIDHRQVVPVESHAGECTNEVQSSAMWLTLRCSRSAACACQHVTLHCRCRLRHRNRHHKFAPVDESEKMFRKVAARQCHSAFALIASAR